MYSLSIKFFNVIVYTVALHVSVWWIWIWSGCIVLLGTFLKNSEFAFILVSLFDFCSGLRFLIYYFCSARTHYIDHANIQLNEIYLPVPLWLKTWVNTPSLPNSFVVSNCSYIFFCCVLSIVDLFPLNIPLNWHFSGKAVSYSKC